MVEQAPEPKIYAPFIVALETLYPNVAPFLVGIGDRPWERDGKKTLVTARFQSECQTPFEGSYVTEFATADGDARTFLGKMVQKFGAVAAEDKRQGKKKTLELAPVAITAPPEDDDHDDPEPAAPPEDADASDEGEGDDGWDEETNTSR